MLRLRSKEREDRSGEEIEIGEYRRIEARVEIRILLWRHCTWKRKKVKLLMVVVISRSGNSPSCRVSVSGK